MTRKLPFQLKLNESLHRYSHRVAVEYGEHGISYSELSQRAARVSRWLLDRELEHGCFVGIYLKNRLDLIAAIIGILNARCVFVVLDYHLPVKRIDTLIETTGIGVLLTDHEGRERLDTQNMVNMALLDDRFFRLRDGAPLTTQPFQSPVEFDREDPIYIYFTSGSTGIPRAILGRNKGLLHFLEWESETFEVDERFRFSQFTVPGFDAFLRDVFTPLLNGATLCIPATGDILPDRPRLINWIDSRHITLIHCVPSVFRLFNDEDLLPDQFLGLKYVIMSGERIPPGQLDNWYRVFGERVRLVNFYGTSETTMVKTCYYIRPSDSKLARIPVGKAIRGARIFVLNEDMAACSQMIAGEVYIRTPFRSHGYYNNPEANEECFIANPFTGDSGDLFHRTGDLGRVLEDDNLDIIGRLDSQVKIRGVRVEPEEVEAVLSAHPLIKEAVVIARQKGDDETYLCAYYLNGNSGGDIPLETLREYLSERFPDYMVPRYFIGLETFPLTSNLKIDRKALPEPKLEAAEDYLAPGNETEALLVEIWADVLGIEKHVIGVQSNFFQLGGHSLKATFMIEKVHKRLNVKLPLAEVFKKNTIAELATFIGGMEEVEFSAIAPVEKREYYPLSSAQKRMFILQQMDLQSTVYNMTQVIPLPVAPDRQRLLWCCMELIRRHHSLRTSFELLKDEPVQRVREMEDIRFDVEYTEIDGSPGDITAGFVRPFNLNRAPLLRVGVFRLSEKQFILVSDMHHIISDGVSLTILEKDFVALYTGQPLQPLTIQYRDYSKWHNSGPQKNNLKRQEEYWLNRMAGEIPILNIPLDYPRPEVQSFEGNALNFRIGSKETKVLKRLALENNATLYMVLLAIYNVFLSKLSGQQEIIVGAPIAGRRHADLDQVIGMFVNTLVLRNFPGPDKTFLQFLEEVKNDTLGAFDNQEYQFEDLVENAGVKRDAGRNPLFDVVYILQNIGDLPVDGPAAPGPAEPRPETGEPPPVQPRRPSRTAKFDLTLMMHEQPGSLHAMFQYSTRLFKEETIQCFIDYFNHVVNAVVDDPKLKLADVQLISESEKERILYDFNRTATGYPREKTIHYLFEEHAERTPDRTAVAGFNRTIRTNRTGWTYMSYRRLNEAALLLADRLRQMGAGPGLIIALKMERSLEMIISILAVLKTGGAYLPIETGFPRERIDYMLNDSTASLMIDEDGVQPLRGSLAPGGENDVPGLAYIIYTSGSTGKPKGVLTKHHNVMRVVRETNYIDIHNSDRLLQLSSYAFDGSVFDIYGALLNGASLVLVPPGLAADVHLLSRLIRTQCVTVFFVTTALFNLMTDETPEIFPYLRKILFGGERVSVSHVRRALEIAGPGKIIHVYGPTETTVFASYYPIEEVPEDAMTIPIGYPLSNTVIYILDKWLEVVPTGITGEIYIGGDGTARGYLNRPELTSEKFIKSFARVVSSAGGFSKEPLAAGGIYKTGDLGRWLPDGSVQFLGRVDFQVKIRGFRIELGEIESELHKRPDIKEAVVIVSGEGSENRTLCAYIVPSHYAPGGSYDIAGIKNELSKTLPSYMVPTHILVLEKLPLNANGKLDRAALPRPGQMEPQTGHEYTAPSTELENRLVKIWSEVLGIEGDTLSIDADFFQLGGHSLKATIMISRLHRACNVKLPLADVFRTPTIRELAQKISGIRKEEFSAVPAAEKREYYPVSSAQKRLYILNGIAPAGTGYNIPYAVTLEGRIDLAQLEQLFLQLIQRHESLRTSFHMIEGQPVQRVHETVDFKIGDIGPVDASGPVEGLLRPFDLTRAPLVRVLTGMLDESRRLLLVDMHHIISDGSSMGVLAAEFTRLASGTNLPRLRLQYKDYSQWQNSPAQRRVLEEQEKYWLSRFEDEIPVLDLPLDYPRPPVRSLEGAALSRVLSVEDSLWLKKIATASGATNYMVLLSLFTLLLSKISGQRDIVVGTPVAARRHTDLEPIIGMFVNTLAMRNRAGGSLTYNEYLHQVKARTLEAFENQEYQFEDLVDRLDVARDAARNPIFDAFFSLPNMNTMTGGTAKQPRPQAGTQTQGLVVKPYGPEPETSKFDLGMTCMESPGAIAVIFKYGTRLFKEQTIIRLWNYFQQIITSLRHDENILLREILIISEEEKQQLLYEFNDSSVEYPSDKTLHQLFIDTAARTPDAIALYGPGAARNRSNGSYLSYNELNRRSDLLAGSLREKGVGPDAIVAVKAERSLEMIISLLGILRAGGAYLPLSMAYPQERMDYILKDSDARWLVEAQSPEPAISTLERAPRRGEPIGSSGMLARSGGVCPNNLAYVIYTSGTTGRPKGVLISHQSAVNVVTWFSRSYGLEPGVRVLNLSDYSFDASVNQIFGTLLSGAQLNLVSKELLLDLEDLRQYIRMHRIGVLNFIPNALHQLLSFSEKIPSLDYVLCGAEKLSETIKNSLLSKGYRVYNHYGPTEASIDTLAAPCREDVPVHLGKPIANMRCYILDPHSQLQPIGVPGELYIAGTGLARGYLNNPELTAEKFTLFQPDQPQSNKRSGGVCLRGNRTEKSVLYRTGDRARWLPDGNIEFLGRIDFQVKIRGFRIEPGEIETRLLECRGVKDAVVIPLEEAGAGIQLAAYVVLDSPGTTKVKDKVKDIEKDLSPLLPDYMMPAAITVMDAFPLTSGGKVNRTQLPAPVYRNAAEHTRPRDVVEKTLASLWAEVLNIPDVSAVGIDDNFFRVGGHSLNATVLSAKIHKALDVKISLGDIFKTPTIRNLADLIKKSESEAFVSVEPVEERDYYMLSSAQKRLFVLQGMEPGGVAYNMPQILPLPAGISIKRLERTFRELISRHESLRTSFFMKGDVPVQRVHDRVAFGIDNIGSITRFHQVSRPFDLGVAPLLRVSIAKSPGKGKLLIMDMHHIISDGVSMEILSREFVQLYEGKQLQPLRIQYKDYALWQNGPGHLQLIRHQERYWLNRFDGEVPVTDLPLDFPRPDLQSFDGNAHLFNLSSEDSQRLKSLAREKGMTLFMLFLGLFNIFLAKLTNEEDIIVGTPVAGRGHSDLEPVVGMFVNTLALRNLPVGRKSFDDFLEEVKAHCLEDFDNQDYQFEDLVEKVVLDRDTSRNPLFDIMFSLQSRDMPDDIPDEAPDRDNEKTRQTTKFDFSLDVTETPGRFILSFQYCIRLFKNETIKRFARYFRQLITALLARPHSPLYSADMLPEDEKHTLLNTFNDTAADSPPDKTLHRLFIDRAAVTPDAIALYGPGAVENRSNRSNRSYLSYLSYNELNRRSSVLAQTLRESGVGPDAIVAVKAQRSLEMVIALLGILRAGGAYLPLSPEYPWDRMEYILKDSNAQWLIDAQGSEPALSTIERAPRRGEPIGSSGMPARSGGVCPDNLAYVIYTSGTTGRPKGVLIHHAGAVNTVSCYARTIGLKPGWALINFSDYTFDASVAQIFGTLLSGGVLHMIPREQMMDIDGLRHYMIIHRIAVADFVPAVLHQMLSYDKKIGNVEIAVSGAERLDETVKNSILAKGYRLFNYYGPTETTIDALRTECRMDRQVDLGTPVSNMRCYILDKYRRLQPLGVPGELYIAGIGLARGYLNRPELTAERFVPFNVHPSLFTVYKTGDLVRWLTDGHIQFLGRIDHQVKIRGFRIEPGEIESHLRGHEDVKESVVLVRQDRSGENYLCAYIVPETPGSETQGLSVPELKQYLASRLPDYMVPAHIVPLEHMPLTLGGKVNRRALPEPHIDGGRDYVAPEGEIEERLSQIWTEVLGIDREQAGVTQDFFRLGGHSLKAVSLISRINKQFAKQFPVTVSLADLFREPTIRGIARLFSRDISQDISLDISVDISLDVSGPAPVVEEQRLVPLKRSSNHAPVLFLVHDGSGEVEGYGQLCRHLTAPFNCWGIRYDTGEELAPRNLTIQSLAAEYLEIVRRIQPGGPYYLAGWSMGGTIAFEMTRQLEQAGEPAALILIDTALPFAPGDFRDFQETVFDMDTESAFLRRYLPRYETLMRNRLESRENRESRESEEDIRSLWQWLADFLVEQQVEPEQIREIVQDFEAQVVSSFDDLSIHRLIAYLNTGRTLVAARRNYTPQIHIKSSVRYFAASVTREKGSIDDAGWEKFCTGTLTRTEIQGDHFSIMKTPGVLELAVQFSQWLEQNAKLNKI